MAGLVSADYNKLFFSFGLFFLFFFSFPYFLLFHWSIPSLFSSPCPTNLSIFPHLPSLSSIRSSTPLSYMYLSTVLLLPFPSSLGPSFFSLQKFYQSVYLKFFYLPYMIQVCPWFYCHHEESWKHSSGSGLDPYWIGSLDSGRPISCYQKKENWRHFIFWRAS